METGSLGPRDVYALLVSFLVLSDAVSSPPPHVPFRLFIDSLPHTPFVILDDVLPGHLERRSDPVGTLAKGGNSEKRCMASRPGSW